MSVITDDSNNIIDPEAEVRKLQDLVKKLEQQNQLLRNKQNEREKDDVFSRTETLDTDFITTPPPKNGPDPAILKESLKNLTLEDVALVEIDGEAQDNEDSWLYQSPVKPSPSQKVVSPYKWARKEFEQPSPEIETAKKSLLYKLEECACRDTSLSRSASVGTLGSSLNSLSLPGGNNTLRLGNDRPRAASTANLHTSGSMPSIRQPAIGLGARVNTGTFTRPKKAKMPAEDVPTPQVNNLVGDGEPLAEEIPQEADEEDTIDGAGHKLTDVSDVQVLARMQEESLRQSFSSPHSLSKKSLSRSMNRSGFGLNDDSPSSNRSSPGRCEVDGVVTRSNNSLDALSSQSPCSTPPDSPYASNQHLDSRQQVPDHRRSLPNLQTSRLSTPSLQHHGSEGRLQPRDSPPRRGGANQRQRGARQASPGRPLSPHRSGIPNPRTSIPRPGAGSRLPTPGKKGGIPMGRRSTGNIRSTLSPANYDDSWKDGCF